MKIPILIISGLILLNITSCRKSFCDNYLTIKIVDTTTEHPINEALICSEIQENDQSFTGFKTHDLGCEQTYEDGEVRLYTDKTVDRWNYTIIHSNYQPYEFKSEFIEDCADISHEVALIPNAFVKFSTYDSENIDSDILLISVTSDYGSNGYFIKDIELGIGDLDILPIASMREVVIEYYYLNNDETILQDSLIVNLSKFETIEIEVAM